MSTFGLTRSRRIWFLLALALGLCVLNASGPAVSGPSAFGPQLAAAQEAAAEKPAAGGEDAAPKQNKSMFIWFLESSGFIGLVLLILSIYFVSTTCRMFIEMRPQVACPPDIVDETEEMLQKRQFKEIYGVVKDDNSLFSRLVATGIAELPNGLGEAREAMDMVGESINADMEKKISMLAVLGTLGPMIGLLGTLKGMIASFSVIALSDTQLKASEVAGGISEALLLTFEGVALSVPAIYFYAVFRNRIATLTVNTKVQADEFLRHFAHAARSKGPAQPSAQQAAAAAQAKVAKA